MTCEPVRCSLRSASGPATVPRRFPSPGESFYTYLRDERSLVPPRLGIRLTAIVQERAALNRPQASSRSHRHHSAQSSIPAPRGCYPIGPMDWDLQRHPQPLTKATSPLVAIRGFQRCIPHTGVGPRRLRHSPPIFQSHTPASFPTTDTLLALHRSEL